jgi:polyhydroxyalkanoate synthase subunit PhaC
MANDPNTSAAAHPIALAAELAWLLPRLASAMSQASSRQLREVMGVDYSLIDYQGVFEATGRFALAWWIDPLRALGAQAELVARSLSLFERQYSGSHGTRASARSVDKRFLDGAWSEDPLLAVVKELYLLFAEWQLAQIRDCPALDDHDKQKLAFYTRQLLCALAPTNALLINPKVRTTLLETGGASLVNGLQNLLRDLEQGSGLFPITQNDPSAFTVGRNLAVTAGKVVHRNDLMELIQYAPRTDSVFRTPVLFVPPWINKYYILDLQPENSFFRWLIGQGHTVFVISWANPNERHAGKGLEHYLREGPLEAIDIVRRITGEDDINLGGFCIGGILAICALAYLWAGGRVPVKSATCLATMVDLSAVGDAAVFIDEGQLANIEKHTRRTGFLEGYHMKDMFSMMRENDLIWSYVINNYLLGRAPPAFDILHWNADSTRLPARMLTDFLRGIYMENSLVGPGRLRLAGRQIDLRAIRTPCYLLSTIEDHIAPWKATYPATQILSGPTEFVLGGSGHIAGVINPPTRKKYGYWLADSYPASADQWLDQAEQHEGSWWPHCAKWLAHYGGPMVAARQVGSNEFPALANAPGKYVLAK